MQPEVQSQETRLVKLALVESGVVIWLLQWEQEVAAIWSNHYTQPDT